MLVLICCPSTGSSADTVHWSLWFSGIGDRRRIPNGRKHCLFWSLPSHPGRTHRSWSTESSFAGNPPKPSVEWIFLCVFFFPQPYREICRWLIPTNQFSETTAMMKFRGNPPSIDFVTWNSFFLAPYNHFKSDYHQRISISWLTSSSPDCWLEMWRVRWTRQRTFVAKWLNTLSLRLSQR